MGGAGSAAATDDLSTCCIPVAGLVAICAWVACAGPATMFCIPGFAGVGIDEDRLVGRGAKHCNQRADEGGMCTVDAYGYGLWEGCNGGGALMEGFTVRDVQGVAASE